ncbi:hypothetical protein [Streptomyces sp. NPDC024089]|uniref:hypothetical protein n=1 Tax=Streptomyces sp. NPDC024089 TaxID=3154328 RepID=UPI0033C078E0
MANGVEPFEEPFALALGEHLGEGPDMPGEGVELGALGDAVAALAAERNDFFQSFYAFVRPSFQRPSG